MIEKGETARELLAASVTKSALIGAIDRDPLQQALDTAPPGTEVNVSALPLLRDDCGETPVAALCSVPRDRTLLLSEALAAGYELTEEDGIKRYRLPNSRARQSSRSRSLDSE
jgi:hypothetical protein